MLEFAKNVLAGISLLLVVCVAICIVSALIGWIGGSYRLATQFPGQRHPSGQRYYMQSGMVGLASYRSCLNVSVSEDGLHVSVAYPFGLVYPPLFFLWHAVKVRGLRRILWRQLIQVDVGTPKIATL